MSDVEFDYDYFVIGAGSGGVRSARIAAAHGAKVGVAEESALGGTCVNLGCVPKKLLSYAAHYGHDFEDAAGFGWDVEKPKHDWSRLISNKNAEIERLNGIYRRILSNNNVDILNGHAVLEGKHEVRIGDRLVTAENILIATGGKPFIPDVKGARKYGISSNEAFYLDALPDHVIMNGGGYIAVEFASIFAALGAEVTLIYRGDMILRGFDDDLRESLKDELVKNGIDVRLNTEISGVEKEGKTLKIELNNGDNLEGDCLFFATGRVPLSDEIGLDKVGVKINEKGAIIVDGEDCTNIDNIYAVGDVTDKINLTPVAIAQGHALADRLYGGLSERYADLDNVAAAVFSIPPIGTVGLTEVEAKEKYGEIEIFKSSFKPMKHTLSGRDEKTMMKLIIDVKTDRVIGAHMMGADAPEIIQGIAIAIKAGATKADFDNTVGIHPTAAEEFVTM